MSKRFWGGLMVFGLFLTLFAGAFLYVNLQEKQSTEVPLTPHTPMTVDSSDDGVTPGSLDELLEAEQGGDDLIVRKVGGKEEASEEEPREEAPEKTVEERPSSPNKVPVKKDASSTRNILFTLYSGSAGDVFLVGEFNEWYREPMKKSGNKWTISKSLEPGRYGYLFIVDDKRINDPNNGKKNSEGHSLLVVKPLNP